MKSEDLLDGICCANCAFNEDMDSDHDIDCPIIEGKVWLDGGAKCWNYCNFFKPNEDANIMINSFPKFKMKHKETGKIYPVKSITLWDDGQFEAVYCTEEEQIEEHVNNGGHYCSSCGSVFYDLSFDEKEVDLIWVG